MRQFVIAAVVLIVVGVMGCLVILGIFRVRETGSRARCLNNLKQLGLAVHNYASTYEQRLPLAAIANDDLPAEKRLSWTVNLLPFVEADNFYRETNKAASWDDPTNAFLLRINYGYYRCPSTPSRRDALGHHVSTYVAIAGVGEGDELRPGVFSFDRIISFPELTDLETTFLFLETSASNGPWSAAGHPTLRSLDEKTPYFGLDGQFSGFHRGFGTIAALADGSVRSLDASMDARVFQDMAVLKRGKAPAKE